MLDSTEKRRRPPFLVPRHLHRNILLIPYPPPTALGEEGLSTVPSASSDHPNIFRHKKKEKGEEKEEERRELNDACYI